MEEYKKQFTNGALSKVEDTFILMLGELQNIIEDLITRVEELEASK